MNDVNFGLSCSCCLAIDATRVSDSQIAALLLHLETHKVKVNVFIGLLCCTRATSTFSSVQKFAI